MSTGELPPKQPRPPGLAGRGRESGYLQSTLENASTGNDLHGAAAAVVAGQQQQQQQQLSASSPGPPVSVGGSEAFYRQSRIEYQRQGGGGGVYHRQGAGGGDFVPGGAKARGYNSIQTTEFQRGGPKRQLVESELGEQDGMPLGLTGGFSGGGNGNGGQQAQRWGSFLHERAEGSDHSSLWGGDGLTNLPANQPKIQGGAAGPTNSNSTFCSGYKHTLGLVSHPAGMPGDGPSAGSLPSAPPRFSSASPAFYPAPRAEPTAGRAVTRPSPDFPRFSAPGTGMGDKPVATADDGSPVFDGSDGIWEDYTNSVIHEGVLVRESGDLMRLSAMPPRFDPTSLQSAAGTYQAMAASSTEFESHFLERSQALRAYSCSLPSACRPGGSLKAQAPLATAIAHRMSALSDENQELRNLTWGGAGTSRCRPEGDLELQRLRGQLGKVRDFNQAAGGAIKELAKELQETDRALREARCRIELLGGVNGTSGAKILENVQKGYTPPREVMIGEWKYVAVGKVPTAAAAAAAPSLEREAKASSPEVGNRRFGGTKSPTPKSLVRGRGGRRRRGGGGGGGGGGSLGRGNLVRKGPASLPVP